LPLEDKRKIVESLIEKIVIGNGEIDITFSYNHLLKTVQKPTEGRGEVRFALIV